jgi:ketosteroid isomerase-like protein
MSNDKARLEANKALIRRFFEATATQGFDKALELVAEDVLWWLPGVEGDLTKADMIAATTRAAAYLDGPMRSEILTLTAEDDRVAAEVRGRARRKTGAAYDNIYHFLFRVADGKITEMREHHDTKYAAEVWADRDGGAVPPRR